MNLKGMKKTLLFFVMVFHVAATEKAVCSNFKTHTICKEVKP
jgi:hypothetical protein